MAGKSKTKKVIFKFFNEETPSVYVAGDFNGWEREPLKKARSPKGQWKLDKRLPQGRYEFKFIVNGEWQLNQDDYERCMNEFGTENNIIDVK